MTKKEGYYCPKCIGYLKAIGANMAIFTNDIRNGHCDECETDGIHNKKVNWIYTGDDVHPNISDYSMKDKLDLKEDVLPKPQSKDNFLVGLFVDVDYEGRPVIKEKNGNIVFRDNNVHVPSYICKDKVKVKAALIEWLGKKSTVLREYFSIYEDSGYDESCKTYNIPKDLLGGIHWINPKPDEVTQEFIDMFEGLKSHRNIFIDPIKGQYTKTEKISIDDLPNDISDFDEKDKPKDFTDYMRRFGRKGINRY